MLREQAVKDLVTLRDFIRWGMSRFNEAEIYFGHGTDNALDEAAYLVLHTLHLPPQIGEPYMDTRLTEAERRKVVDILLRRVEERLPAPYLTHEAWYGGIPFYVDERVLIPRSPIIELVEAHFEPWVQPEKVHNILDLCTGSGCIAITCAAAFPEAHVDAADISRDALAVADINVERYDMGAPSSPTCSAPSRGSATTSSSAIPPMWMRRTWPPCPRSTATSRRWRWRRAPTGSSWC
jgi:ribosomal protein L3 glutamine methyltransferase